MNKLSALLMGALLVLGLASCGDDKEGNAEVLSTNCKTQLEASGAPSDLADDVCGCYGTEASEQYSTDELNDLLAEGNEEEGAAALQPILLDCAEQNGVDLTDTGADPEQVDPQELEGEESEGEEPEAGEPEGGEPEGGEPEAGEPEAGEMGEG